MNPLQEKQPLSRAQAYRSGAVALMDAAALIVIAGWLAVSLGVLYPRTAADMVPALLSYGSVLQARVSLPPEELWRWTLLVLQGGGAVLMYLGVALWRLHVRRHTLPYGRQARRAVHTCRIAGAAILLVQGVLAYAAWRLVLRGTAGLSIETYLCVLGAYPLHYLLSIVLRYFGAPAAFASRRGVLRRV